MSPEQVQVWLDRYVEAWRTYDPELIESLFTPDATYAYHPWDEPIRGAALIAADWLADPDPPGSWEADYRPVVVEGHRAAATGQTSYSDGRTFWNVWLLAFDDSHRCSEFVEWYMTPD